MLDDRKVEKLRVFQSTSKQTAVHDGLAIVGDADDARFNHFADLGQRFAFLALGDGPNRKHERGRRPSRFRNDVRRNRRIIVRRLRVRHRRYCRESSGNGGRPSCRDRFGLLGSRFTKVHMNIEETRRDNQARGIKVGNVRSGGLTYRSDFSVDDEDIGRPIEPARRIENAAVFDEQVHDVWPPSIRKRIAMRTATPAATWSRITE